MFNHTNKKFKKNIFIFLTSVLFGANQIRYNDQSVHISTESRLKSR